MKYVLSNIIVLIVSVVFLYYLFNNPTFIPQNGIGDMNWLNIAVLLFIFFLILNSFLAILSFFILYLFKGRIDPRKRRVLSFKIGLVSSMGMVLIFFLNFFHVLSWIWGVSILVVVIMALFVI